MSGALDSKSKSVPLTAQQRQQIITRSTALIDSLSDIAVEIAADFIGKSECTRANTMLLQQPEILAVRALEQASKRLLKSMNKPGNISIH